jgi:4-hydroxybutyryl-CoA dehydratase/vinylacetyl-CoA-Delta-isomerase
MIEKYLVGKAGIPAEHRMRVIKYANLIASAGHMATTMHAEGSPAAQKLTIWATADFDMYKAAARRTCGISDGSEHPEFEGLPPFDPADLPV